MDDDELETTETTTPPPATPPPVTPPAGTAAPTTQTPAPERATGSGGGTLEGDALKERLLRAAAAERKRVLVEAYGTDDPTKIEQIKREREEADAERKRLKRIQEARERGRMSEQQKREAELAQERQRREALENELKTLRTDIKVREQDQVIQAAAAKHVDPEYLRYARRDLAEHLNELKNSDPKKFKTFGAKELDKWFEKYAKERPVFARKPDSPPPAEASPPPVEPPKPKPTPRVVATTKPPAVRPAVKTTGGTPTGKPDLTGKTPRPGQPNSMTREELRVYMAEKGIRPY